MTIPDYFIYVLVGHWCNIMTRHGLYICWPKRFGSGRPFKDLQHISKLLKWTQLICLVTAAVRLALGLKGSEEFWWIATGLYGGLALHRWFVRKQDESMTADAMVEALKRCGCLLKFILKDVTVQFWFQRSEEEWPKLRLYLATLSIPVQADLIPSWLHEALLETLLPVLDKPVTDQIFREAKKRLIAEGVSHVIDVDGWDTSELTRIVVGRIMDAQLTEQNASDH